MSGNREKLGDVSPSDARLIRRVQKLREQATISEMLLDAHLGEEYQLKPGVAVDENGEIWGPVSTPTLTGPTE